MKAARGAAVRPLREPADRVPLDASSDKSPYEGSPGDTMSRRARFMSERPRPEFCRCVPTGHPRARRSVDPRSCSFRTQIHVMTVNPRSRDSTVRWIRPRCRTCAAADAGGRSPSDTASGSQMPAAAAPDEPPPRIGFLPPAAAQRFQLFRRRQGVMRVDEKERHGAGKVHRERSVTRCRFVGLSPLSVRVTGSRQVRTNLGR
jgi:hypothetical protein